MKAEPVLTALVLAACASSSVNEPRSAADSGGPSAASMSDASPTMASAQPSSPLSDGQPVAFRADFANLDLQRLWNLFGGQNGNREVRANQDGLLVRIQHGERPWDAVGLRTSRVEVNGDFDLRGRFRDFEAPGNASAKLIAVDAASPKGEAAYVERIQIDGKNLFKFGGEIEGSLENWGYVATEALAGDLRLVRREDTLHAYARTDESQPWKEFAPPQPVPKSMPALVKVGVKLSCDVGKNASVLWTDITLDGKLVRD